MDGSGYKLAAVFGAIVGLGALVVSAIALSTGGATEAASPEAEPSEGTPSASSQAIVPLALDVELGDLYIEPRTIEIPSGASIIANVSNVGALPHNFVLVQDGEEVGTPELAPGETAGHTFGPFTSTVQLICSIPGHAAAGMVMDVVVTGSAAGHADGDHAAGSGGDAAQIDPNAAPGPDWERRDPALAPAEGEGGTLHQVTFSMTETVIEVAPGVTQELWTFEDMVPGPVLRGKVGDTFEVTIVNNGRLGHSIDFHASKVAWNDEMRTIQPGESLVYTFEAKHAGIFMYHCGTAPALHHVGNGMFGAIIIDPPNLPEVDREFVFVQSEFYLGPEGEPGDLTKMQQDDWDAVVFNGYFNQYAHAPIRIEPDERVRVWVLDAGPSENSSFHVIGTIFDTVFKEGVLLLQPDETQGGAQTIDLQPAQGGYVEFTMDEAGLYPFVTHKFSNVGKGALGIFQAGEVAATDGVAH